MTPRLAAHDLVAGLERFGDRYGALQVFADDVAEPDAFTPIADGRLRLVVDTATYVLELRGAVARLSRADAPAAPAPGSAAALAAQRAAVDAALERKGPGWAAGLILGLLVGAPLGPGADAPRRIFPLRFEEGGWRAYDGGLLRWMKGELAWPAEPAFRIGKETGE